MVLFQGRAELRVEHPGGLLAPLSLRCGGGSWELLRTLRPRGGTHGPLVLALLPARLALEPGGAAGLHLAAPDLQLPDCARGASLLVAARARQASVAPLGLGELLLHLP